jgi:hypothetical protein
MDTLNMTETMRAMVEAVKAHATAHYNEGGWDYVIETMDDGEIAGFLARDNGRPATPEHAIKVIGTLVGTWNDAREYIEKEAF